MNWHSAAFQIGIVLASAAVITGMLALAWLAGALGVIGLCLTALGVLAACGSADRELVGPPVLELRSPFQIAAKRQVVTLGSEMTQVRN